MGEDLMERDLYEVMTVYVEDSRIPGTIKGTPERENYKDKGQNI